MTYAIGKTYEELNIGDKAHFSKTIAECDVYSFAGICGDFNPIHMDESYAKTTQFKARIAHGALPQSLIMPVLGLQLPGPGAILLEITTKFIKPTFIGDTVTATATISEKMEAKKRVRMTLEWTNQNNELTAVGNAVLIPPKA